MGVRWNAFIYNVALFSKWVSMACVLQSMVRLRPRYRVPAEAGRKLTSCSVSPWMRVISGGGSTGVQSCKIPHLSGSQWYSIPQHFLGFRAPPVTWTNLSHHHSWVCAVFIKSGRGLSVGFDACSTMLSMKALRLQMTAISAVGSVIMVGVTLV